MFNVSPCSNIFNFNSGYNGQQASAFAIAKMESEQVAEEVLRLAQAGYSGEDIVNSIGQVNLENIMNDDRMMLESHGIYLTYN